MITKLKSRCTRARPSRYSPPDDPDLVIVHYKDDATAGDGEQRKAPSAARAS